MPIPTSARWLALALALLAAPATAAAQALSLGLDAGALFFDDGITLTTDTAVLPGLTNADPARSFGARAVLHFSPRLGVEAVYLRSDLENAVFELTSHIYYSTVELRLPLGADVGVRLAAGGGGITFAPSDDAHDDLTDAIAAVELGLGVGATDHLSFWLDGRGYNQFCSGQSDDDAFRCEDDASLRHAGIWAGATYTF
ncbi:MAG: outer membrane beta-barrel protein [Longimicrobiales bacterium]